MTIGVYPIIRKKGIVYKVRLKNCGVSVYVGTFDTIDRAKYEVELFRKKFPVQHRCGTIFKVRNKYRAKIREKHVGYFDTEWKARSILLKLGAVF